ncbi:GAT domain-containing protein [Histoplasma capsulatum var. duboisii H88]|uniref:GAT domain-containing protein n=1 Tax=Ajellomyces capsulatus (strain H88) TaxID=544711 RepID=A0A8A1LNK4_AJEC8|nr:GAT domain-containing protein [Histoplasma capsulatum var. duboisii H88]
MIDSPPRSRNTSVLRSLPEGTPVEQILKKRFPLLCHRWQHHNSSLFIRPGRLYRTSKFQARLSAPSLSSPFRAKR